MKIMDMKTRQDSHLERSNPDLLRNIANDQVDSNRELRTRRSSSLDDVYALATSTNGLPSSSPLAYVPLDVDSGSTKTPRSASFDDLSSLADAYGNVGAEEDVANEPFDGATAAGAAAEKGKEASVTKHLRTHSGSSVASSVDGARETVPGVDGVEEEESPAIQLFGRERAQELRERIRKSRGVSRRVAARALDTATASLMAGSADTEVLEFITWFSVWLLVVFYLLFYSSYGPALWRLLHGPLGVLLALPFAFAALFWLARYLLLDDNEPEEDPEDGAAPPAESALRRPAMKPLRKSVPPAAAAVAAAAPERKLGRRRDE